MRDIDVEILALIIAVFVVLLTIVTQVPGCQEEQHTHERKMECIKNKLIDCVETAK